MKKRKQPLRKCVVTQEMKPKKELIRVVRTPEGDIVIDATGKKSGRGAYLSFDETVIQQAKANNTLQKHLQHHVDDTVYDELLETVKKENKTVD